MAVSVSRSNLLSRVQLFGILHVALVRDAILRVFSLPLDSVTNLSDFLALHSCTAIPRSCLAGLLISDLRGVRRARFYFASLADLNHLLSRFRG